VDHDDGSQHDQDVRGGREAHQETDDHAQAAEEFADGHQVADGPQHPDQTLQALATKSPEQLLGPVGDEDDAHHQAHHQEREVHCRPVRVHGPSQSVASDSYGPCYPRRPSLNRGSPWIQAVRVQMAPLVLQTTPAPAGLVAPEAPAG